MILDNQLSHSSGDRFIYSGISEVGVFVRIQQMVCDQQLNGLSSSADRFIKSSQQMLLSRSAEAFFREFSRSIVSADGYSDFNQQMLYKDNKTF
ncbi:hypothetical protein F511_26361 [Dorcoceras hygrometricum]|uniref:Uncharacterized protein n=1 Tax=Dorcoceras hygrometricum TaxID=472368 RepID=A0A2Z7BNY7_9LAMI|nr:hypothetical protein F511_26361 [Dorcoceras hygrometricum]